ncbi:hypothetical protein [Bacillus alveayuensis]|jgi:hypothetical protein|uniref:hypothetical protein n=1 Tax=Aeribacillus alveayuensis TaxID=279215 RepID=UPI000A6D39EA|nr:hypothetical protein [Bacillus alveayuensis]
MMKYQSLDLMKISQALDHTYTLLEENNIVTDGRKQIEAAKETWKQAFTYILSNTLRI